VILFDPSTVVYSASDLTAASNCEWALMRKLDAKLGRIDAVVEVEDDMLKRTGLLGDAHELRTLEELRATKQVVEIGRPENVHDIQEAADATSRAFAEGAEVVFQAAFFDGRFLGYADFIIRIDDDAEGRPRYEVYDTKLARRAKITALLQLAAYSEQLQLLGVSTGDEVHLILGNGVTSSHRLADILPVYRKRRARLESIIDGRLADPAPTYWGDPRYAACGRCTACEQQVELHHDVLLVAGLRATQRARLRAAGVETIEQLAGRRTPVDGISDATLTGLRDQAAVQLETAQRESARLATEGVGADGTAPPAWRVANPSALAAIPAPDDGDIFFDFEGDPLYREGNAWGLDYLFGLIETDETFVPFWAHSFAEERLALIAFLDYLTARRETHPRMHVYHYASYERTHLLSLAARHGYGEEIIDDLLRNNVLVDLYPVVKQGLRIGSRSYSLKKLEPLYMDVKRDGVANAADSITEYVRYRDLLDDGETAAAASVLADIARYNEYDCRSTLRLRDWLLQRAAENAAPAPVELDPELDMPLPVPLREPDPVYLELAALLEGVSPTERTPDQSALALASAAIDYHRRELKSFWWDHFSRLANPVEDWADTRDVLVVSSIEVERDWYREGRQRSDRRILLVGGALAPGSSVKVGANPFLLYEAPYPPITRSREPGSRTAHKRATVLDVIDESVFRIEEVLEQDAPRYSQLPMAFTPATPPPAGSQVDAISGWGRRVLDALPAMLSDAALDVLRRVPPRLRERGASSAPRVGATDATAAEPAEQIRDTLLALDHSYLAVQGPPGTGKTFTGSKVIVDLVRNHGWRVGVVAQSHAAVENMLAGIVAAGLDPDLVGKKPKKGSESDPVPWSGPSAGTVDGFPQESGFVLGGTAWTFSNANYVPRQSLDLLVIDEAGQFSLASTIAAAVSAERLLLLGDPQQLPQVSQGTHPEPVDESALGWLSAGHNVLPAEFGFFLATSWRMHPAVCLPVSKLSYEGKLVSHASDRSLGGVAPGLHPTPVEHADNSTSSPEEAAAVLAIVRDVVGRPWSSRGETAPLRQDNVIVVAPYNAQVELLRHTLDAAGLEGVPVGTVDKFQGREAAVAIVSLAASSADDVPRGLEFLLLANRLNVAISRAQWAAYLVYSPAITEHLPNTVETLAKLSVFIELVEPTT
jgi:predicted RecB family nuclease